MLVFESGLKVISLRPVWGFDHHMAVMALQCVEGKSNQFGEPSELYLMICLSMSDVKTSKDLLDIYIGHSPIANSTRYAGPVPFLNNQI